MRAGLSIPSRLASLALGTSLAASLAPGCGAEPPPPPVALHLAQFALEGETAVLLNEALDFHFDADLDPASVTGESVRVVDRDGRPARGSLEVFGSRLSFHPALPLAGDYSDGGLRPGEAYRVVLLGFPFPDALRSLEGRPLSGTRRLAFRTVAVGPDAPGPYFEDPSLSLTRTLRLVSERIDAFDSIVLEASEALDPASVDGADFELRGGDGRERIPVRALLLHNAPDLARLALTPHADDAGLRLSLAPGSYHLWTDPRTLGLTDLGGHPVLPPWVQPVDVEVVERSQVLSGEPRPGWSPGGGAVETDRMHETFLGPHRRSPLLVEGVDGTAWWDESGVVTIRLPAAAGDGRDGAVELAERESRSDVRAVRLTVPAGRRTVVDGTGHLVVLRAQGSLVIEGDLDVRRPAFPAVVFGLCTVARLFGGPRGVPSSLVGNAYRDHWAEPELSLSAWLGRAQEASAPWTVLIAGGDIRVEGSVRCQTPLLLVAGGWIRASGPVSAAGIFVLGTGGGNLRGRSTRIPLFLDPPFTNPLREPMTWAVLSQPWQPPRGVDRWLPALYEGRAGGGAFRVRFLGERRGPEGFRALGPVDDPSQLEDCEAVRFRVELDMAPGGAWAPPRVDFVELGWTVPEEEGPR